MGRVLIRRALRRSLAQIRHVSPVRPGSAQDLVARVYEQVERDFGMLAPPVSLHSPAPESLAACWLMLRETLVAKGLVDRATKEAVAAAVSLSNACPYCVEVHDATLHGLVAEPDAGMRAVAQWAGAAGAGEVGEAPFAGEWLPEIVGVAVTFHYLNRMVNVFLGESPLPPGVPAGARDGARRLLGRFMRPTSRNRQEPGLSLDLLPAAPLPEDLLWAGGNSTVGEAFARTAAVVDAAGERSVPEAVRGLVAARLSDWDGRPVGPSRAWVSEAVSGLSAELRPAGRLALLTAAAGGKDACRNGAPPGLPKAKR